MLNLWMFIFDAKGKPANPSTLAVVCIYYVW